MRKFLQTGVDPGVCCSSVLTKTRSSGSRRERTATMAQYLILIYEDEASWANAGQEGYEQAAKEHGAFAENNGAALRGGNALHPTTTATSIRKDASGGFAVTDGA